MSDFVRITHATSPGCPEWGLVERCKLEYLLIIEPARLANCVWLWGARARAASIWYTIGQLLHTRFSRRLQADPRGPPCPG
eukprot:2090060-Prymnesium_polylepis.1